MFVGEKDLSHKSEGERERSQEEKKEKPDEKMSLSTKSVDFFKESQSKPTQELTLSYLCENPGNFKGKQVVVISESSNQDHHHHHEDNNNNKWVVERDFLNLNHRGNGNPSKRQVVEEIQEQGGEEELFLREKKPKLETLNLSLALPDVSLSNNYNNNNNNTITSCSNDFTAASMSYSYSHPFSHNPSCSLTNGTEYFGDDQIWCGGEGTNGSVHSRFRPIGGDGLVALNNQVNPSIMQGNRAVNTTTNNNNTNTNNNNNNNNTNSLYRTASSDTHSFFPSELPARPRMDTHSGDSRRRENDNNNHLKDVESLGGGRVRNESRPERIVREIVSESVPVMCQVLQELSVEVLEATKEYLKRIISMPEKKEELIGLQTRLDRRSDFTKETLSKCHNVQLEILVAVKMGLAVFLSGKIRVPMNELVEIFLFLRCRNVNCKSLLPVDDCDCKICSANKGFCSSCMCPVCLNFDCASNTCSWVGCDVCSHWCHAACGIQKNLIKPGPSLKGPSGTSEMQFHCIGCGHASEMFGFVKDVFMCCANDWGLETLKRELDCVRKIFRGSDDFKGRQLHIKGDELLSKLERKMMSPSDACDSIIQFFNYSDDMPDFPASSVSSKDLMPTQASLRKDGTPITQPTSLPPKYNIYNISSSSGRHDLLLTDLHQNDLKATLLSDPKIEDEFQFGTLAKNDGFDSLESIVRIKEAEAKMFQGKADEARREAEGIRRMIRLKSDQLEEEYAEKLGKLCLKETEERRRKKLEELKVLENSHCDYYKMKLRMQAEIAGLSERMEATKQQWV